MRNSNREFRKENLHLVQIEFVHRTALSTDDYHRVRNSKIRPIRDRRHHRKRSTIEFLFKNEFENENKKRFFFTQTYLKVL